MIEVNGVKVDWQENMTVEEVLKKMDYTYPLIVVRVNGKLVEKNHWSTYPVPNQAIVQAHHMIAGG